MASNKPSVKTGIGPATGGRRFNSTVARDLGIAIVAGVYPPGTVLSGEIEFADRLNVSRSVYREAIRMLVAKGLVESRPKAGTIVTDRSRWNLTDPDMLAWSFASEPDPAFVRDLFELRAIVEPAAAELAAKRRTGEQLSRMGHAVEEMARYGLGKPEGRAADQLFHRTLLAATHNSLLVSHSSSIEAAVSWTTVYKQRERRLPRDPLPDHRRLFDAIADADPKAAYHAMADLVRLALEDMGLSIPG